MGELLSVVLAVAVVVVGSFWLGYTSGKAAAHLDAAKEWARDRTETDRVQRDIEAAVKDAARLARRPPPPRSGVTR